MKIGPFKTPQRYLACRFEWHDSEITVFNAMDELIKLRRPTLKGSGFREIAVQAP
jgi:hypothetical protein